MTLNNEFESIWKKVVVTLSYYPEICVEKPRKNQNLRIVGI
jgi:hypothetical protein